MADSSGRTGIAGGSSAASNDDVRLVAGTHRGAALAAPLSVWHHTIVSLWLLAWCLGTWVQTTCAEPLGRPLSAAVAAAALTLLVLTCTPPRRLRHAVWARALCVALTCAAMATAVTDERSRMRLNDRLPAELEHTDLNVEGEIASVPAWSVDGWRFVFEPTRLDDSRPPLPNRLSLFWARDRAGDTLGGGTASNPHVGLHAGQRWRLPVRLKRPHGVVNPGGFDAELWMFEQGFGATGSVRTGGAASDPVWLGASDWCVDCWRQRWRDRVLTAHPDAAGRLLAALSVGDQSALSAEDWEIYRITGTAHLVAISGLHITMLAWLGQFIGRAAASRMPSVVRRLPAPAVGRWAGWVLAVTYAVLAGWGVPAQRTVIMLSIILLLRHGAARWPSSLVLLLAATAVAMVDPWSLLQPGFWLSFGAVSLLMLGHGGDANDDVADTRGAPAWRRHLLALLRTQALATLGLAPLSLVMFGQVSLVGYLANLLAVPWMTLVITPLALTGMLLPQVSAWAAWAALPLLELLRTMAGLPWAQWHAASAPVWAVVAAAAGLPLALLRLPAGWRLAGVAMVLPLLWPPVVSVPAGQFDLIALDVGQGTAVLVRTARHALLYDTGPALGSDDDAGRRTVVPLLHAVGVRRLDTLVLSHSDTDHVGGAASVSAAWPDAAVLGSLPAGHVLRHLGRGAWTSCRAGMGWQWDGVRFEVLRPARAADDLRQTPNASSCVLRISAASGASALLPGDIEAAQEAALVEAYGSRLRSDVLVVPHHGSRTSSTSVFLDSVAPCIGVVQAGYMNRFGHPREDVLRRYENRGIAVVRTDRCGAWRWSEDGVECTRTVRQRYWTWRDSAAVAEDGGAVVACHHGDTIHGAQE